MSIWNKVLVGLIFVASLGFLVLGARALKTHQAWGVAVEKVKADIEAAQQRGRLLEYGDDTTMGVRQAKVALHELMVDRGRVWHNCTPQRVQVGGQQGVTLSLTTDLPDPNGIAVKTVLFIFEEKDVQEGGAYLGEFTVTGKGDKDLQLVPATRLNARELQRLQKSQGPWALYEVMPVDQHKLLAQLGEEEIRAMFPDDTEDQYIADAKAVQAEADNPDAAKPPRQLRDYEILFNERHKQRAAWNDAMADATRDLEYLEAALADAKQQEQFRRDEIATLEQEKKAELAQLAAVSKHREAVESRLAEVQASVKSLINDNQTLASDIARIQLEATQQIDEATERVAQATNL